MWHNYETYIAHIPLKTVEYNSIKRFQFFHLWVPIQIIIFKSYMPDLIHFFFTQKYRYWREGLYNGYVTVLCLYIFSCHWLESTIKILVWDEIVSEHGSIFVIFLQLAKPNRLFCLQDNWIPTNLAIYMPTF